MGIEKSFQSPYGEKKIIYADWTASGRMYGPIEEVLNEKFYPFTANTHTETNYTGTVMTQSYHIAQQIIKKHVNAGKNDVLISTGTGMTGAINKFQRILGLKVPEQLRPFCNFKKEEKPVVFITHMEHHSNHTSWLETLADVVVLLPDSNGLVCEESLIRSLEQYKDRKLKIGAFTACSNVTGIRTDYHKLAKIMHQNGAYCFVDFAASAPYVDINMHPEDELEKLDAIFFSPHKFLGGPGSSGILIFDAQMYHNRVPDHPGGGTVNWTNPWGEHSYIADVEAREDGGTPGFLQTIRAALAIKLKEEMKVENILRREEEILKIAFENLRKNDNLHILADHIEHRLAIISLYVDNLHYNLLVKLLNDHFGIQTRGGCSCAGTYGHFLLNVDIEKSHSITKQIDEGILSDKPGWVRISFHPTTSNDEVLYVCDAVSYICKNFEKMADDYVYSSKTNEYSHKSMNIPRKEDILPLFEL